MCDRAYPWRWLCLAIEQMMRTRRLRRMTRHLSQRGLTEAVTFIVCPYLNRYVILPRDRSYGESSTRTRSPGRMRM